MINIKDVASHAGVSISTVSRVLNSSKAVSAKLTEKVEKSIEETGYISNSIARGLKIVRTNKIAVIFTSLSRTFFTSVLEGINKEAEKRGYYVVVAESYDDIKREKKLIETFASQWVDGIIIATSIGDNSESARYVSYLEKIEKKGIRIPVVTIEFPIKSQHISAVIIDQEKAAYKAVKYLIEKIGRRRIIHIGLPKGHIIGDMRLEGYKRAIEEAGIEYSEDMVFSGDYTTYSGYSITNSLLKENKEFDAVFCANDQMAIGVIKACQTAKIKIPEQIAIVGNDDIFAASIITPTLTSISVPKVQLGVESMRLIGDILEEQYENEKISKRRIVELQTGFIERESTLIGAEVDLRFLDW